MNESDDSIYTTNKTNENYKRCTQILHGKSLSIEQKLTELQTNPIEGPQDKWGERVVGEYAQEGHMPPSTFQNYC